MIKLILTVVSVVTEYKLGNERDQATNGASNQGRQIPG